MRENADRGRRDWAFSRGLDNLGDQLQLRTRYASQDAGSDLVQILTELTSVVERFDSMVMLQREVLERRTGTIGGGDDAELNRRLERISLEAEEMVTCARGALEQLRWLGEQTKPLTRPASHRNLGRGLARDRRQV
jgi:hypothetical protein